ncbi:gap junction alpha-9 protein-like [Syngnathus scovelli]|uniref:gap junction alpha-9 protein-like n=1 Tax=Syngnathus scovelli TaxID=161590 RepID=UPI002110B493|nr:gap junction alpha-9 protein-like [Syngnathus scovelli]
MNDGGRSEGEVIPTHLLVHFCFAALFFCGEDRMTHGDLSHHRQSVHAGSHNGKMDDWNVLGGILEELHAHSTMVGKMWLTLLLVFRMLVLGVAAEDVWTDEQDHFACNTQQPGCRNACYDLAFPVSLVRFWVLQVVSVASPSLVYAGHTLYRLRALKKARRLRKVSLRRRLEEAESDESKQRIELALMRLERGRCNKAPLRGALLRTYVAHVLTRSAVEVGFMAGQYLLYGVRLYPLFKCQCYPCPDTIDCYMSKPTEKSIFMVFMQFMAALSLILNVLEILNLASKVVRRDISLVTERQQESALAMAELSSAKAGQFIDTS